MLSAETHHSSDDKDTALTCPPAPITELGLRLTRGLCVPNLVAATLFAAKPGFQSLNRPVLRGMDFDHLPATLTAPPPLSDQCWIAKQRPLNTQHIKARHIL